MKDTTLDPGVQSVIDDINNGKMTTTYQAEGKPALLFDTNTVYSDEKGEQWRKENDYGGTLWDRASSKIMDIYRNMFSDDAMKMKDAKQYGDELGISSQFLMDNEDALEEARRIHDEAIQWSFLSGQPFNAENIDTMYPEIKKMREADPVGASIALQNYHDLKETRNIFKPVINFASDVGQLFSDAAASGADMVRLYDAQMKAVESGDIEGNRPYIEELANKLNEEEKAKPDDFAGEVVYEAIKQLTIYGTQGIRALQYVPKSMALAMTAAAPAALAAGASSLGIGAAAVETGAGLTGAAWGVRVYSRK